VCIFGCHILARKRNFAQEANSRFCSAARPDLGKPIALSWKRPAISGTLDIKQSFSGALIHGYKRSSTDVGSGTLSWAGNTGPANIGGTFLRAQPSPWATCNMIRISMITRARNIMPACLTSLRNLRKGNIYTFIRGCAEQIRTWVKRRFLEVAEPLATYIDPNTGQSRCFVPATVYDNPSLINSDPLYVKRLEALPEAEKKRLLYGDWDTFEGQVFNELSQQSHGCDPFQIPPEWEKFCVFDWGYGRPWAALWFAVDFEGTLYLYRARYGMGKGDNGRPDPNKGLRQTNSEICHEIIKIEQRERINLRIADPACWGPTKIRGSNSVLGPSFVEDAANEGLYFMKADNDRLRGKQQVHQRLKIDEEIDRDTGEVISESPKFYAFTSDEFGDYGVKRWWNEMQNLREDPKNIEDVDTNQPDEGYDCFRYAAMSRPITPKRIDTVPAGSFAAERRRMIRAKQYARRHGLSLAAAYSRVR
jgi:hypothetical protein